MYIYTYCIYIYIRHRAPRHRGSAPNVLTVPGTGYWCLVSGAGLWSLLRGHTSHFRVDFLACMTFSQLVWHHSHLNTILLPIGP